MIKLFKVSFWIGVFCFLGVLSACSSTKQSQVLKIDELENLQSFMTGSYDSAQQAAEDSSYYNISLHMYPIWNKKKGGKYLYVEQAIASMQDRPYRQRIYMLQQMENGSIASYVYTIKSDSLFIGKWKDVSYFDRFGLSILNERKGCEVVLNKTEIGYEGSTVANNCLSNLRGANYAKSVVTIGSNQITSWDQGFDKNGEQVWGARKGPYIFVKMDK